MQYLRKSISSPLFIIVVFSSLKLLIHLYTNIFGGYGYFRDELYYLACSNNLDAGYVDHPPFSIYMLWISRLIFGDSLFALRLFPSLCAAAVVYLTGLITLKFNGGKFALLIALTAMLLSPISLAMNTIFSMNAFDWLFWTLNFYLIIQLFQTRDKKYWYYIGIVTGLGLLNKTGFFWMGAGLLAGILITKERRILLTREPYIAAGIALLIFSPYIIWNILYGFPHKEFIDNAVALKYSELTPIDFISGLFLLQNPLTFILWIAGLVLLIRCKETAYKIPGIIFLTAFTILLINWHSKSEYLAPAFPLLFAAGGTAIESFRKITFNWVRSAYVASIAFSGILIAPNVLPVLPVETYIKYSQATGMMPSSSEGHELNQLHQFYADMFGWENLAAEVSEVYAGLSDEEKAKTFVFAQNYGEAGAIEFFSNKYELPKVLSPHNSYWLWGKEEIFNFEYQTVIIIGGDAQGHSEALMDVEYIKNIDSKYAIPYEAHLPIFIGRGFKVSIPELWERIKVYI